jgi:nicotine blue oxidoreductase
MTRAAGLLLAAGSGSRFGRPKALVEIDGRALVRRGVELLQAGGCDPVVVTLGAAADQVLPLLPDGIWYVEVDWTSGMGESLGRGIRQVEMLGAAACVVALVDQPLVGPEAVRRLQQVDADAVVATYDGRRGHPVLLHRRTWQDVMRGAQGDAGARAWLRANPDRVVEVDCTGTGTDDDVDTPDDLARLLARTTGDRP